MMISPLTGSPSAMEMALATMRMMTRGLANKRRKLTEWQTATPAPASLGRGNAVAVSSLLRSARPRSFAAVKGGPPGPIPEASERCSSFCNAHQMWPVPYRS